MTYELTNEEKSAIVNQHVKNLEYNIYNLQVSLIEENAVSTPDASKISSLSSQISESNAKKTALLAELDDLTE
ncbi:hypothetical protein FJZ33_02765 [Candidatus Poribacteria bacterium]|nr:hypothetical protein [Candidatus Poribacteria bacterium]